MQLALVAGSADRGTESYARTTGLLAAGIALAGAGMLAVSPVSPLAPAVTHQPAVELTATTAENLDYIMDLLNGPNPIATALGELSSYYGEVTQNSLDGLQAGLEIMWSGGGRVLGLENMIPQALEAFQNGDFTEVWNLINNDWLYNMNNIFQPLFDHVPRGEDFEVPGVMGIGADMTHVLGNLQELFGDFSFWKSTAKYLMEPLTGFAFALSENLSGVPDGVAHVAQDPFDALLNGYITWDSDTGEDTGQWWGLLTEQGTFSYFLDVLPSRIAEALTANLPVDEVVDPDVGASLADPGLFDLDWLTGLFN
ncbi:hypothetical protein [Mycobacterium sp. pW045]|uniref:hypothetical protein n=1 Tax=Mycobacterium sp. pW045 TaxID=3238984 RepID=UPI00351AB1E7